MAEHPHNALQFSWKYPWGNRAADTLMAALLRERYLWVYPGRLYPLHGKRGYPYSIGASNE